MNFSDTAAVDRAAQAILAKNDRGGYTIPTDGLYPFQWNWDSAFTTLGWATVDIDRAWREVETLISAQWSNGMVPHIVFWHDDEGYFPGHAEWGAGQTPPTSGITQPPVAATLVRQLLDHEAAVDQARLRPIVVALDRWHQWFSTARDPDGRGLVAIVHPWESGRDNLPDWDKPLSYVDTSGVGEYRRRDTQHIDADQRPQKADYDRYMALVQFGRDNGWDDAAIAAGNPFWVADVGINAILRRAERDLVYLADAVGEPEIARRAAARVARLDEGFETLWSDAVGGYVTYDLRHDAYAETLTAGSWLAFYGGAVPGDRAARMRDTLANWMDKVRFAVPSFDPTHPDFDSVRYWRGPVWAIVNWMIADGLARHGDEALAERIRNDTGTLISEAGFYEYFCPLTARGVGGNAFSWTAAVWLGWASPSRPGYTKR